MDNTDKSDVGALHTIQQAADEFAVSPRQVRRFIESGELEVVYLSPRTPRITAEARQAFLDKRRATTQQARPSDDGGDL